MFRTFLLFYAIPCLYGILPDEYLNHLASLVNGVFLLLQESITPENLRDAHRALIQFCAMFKELYGQDYETFNMHSLLHLSTKVEDLGHILVSSMRI